MAKLKTENSPDGNGNGALSSLDAAADGALSPARASPVWAEGKHKRFLAKEVIYREGDPAERIYRISDGLVKLLSYLPNGRARIVRLHTRGQWLGLEGLLGQPYEHTAVAIYDVEMQHFSVQSARRLHQENPHALSHLLCQWHGDLVQADKWISEFSTGGIKPRVARLLEYLAQLECGQPADRCELLTVHEMADILGVTPESVSRILAGFKRSDILQRQADPLREIYRLDSERLQQEARQ